MNRHSTILSIVIIVIIAAVALGAIAWFKNRELAYSNTQTPEVATVEAPATSKPEAIKPKTTKSDDSISATIPSTGSNDVVLSILALASLSFTGFWYARSRRHLAYF